MEATWNLVAATCINLNGTPEFEIHYTSTTHKMRVKVFVTHKILQVDSFILTLPRKKSVCMCSIFSFNISLFSVCLYLSF